LGNSLTGREIIDPTNSMEGSDQQMNHFPHFKDEMYELWKLRYFKAKNIDLLDITERGILSILDDKRK